MAYYVMILRTKQIFEYEDLKKQLFVSFLNFSPDDPRFKCSQNLLDFVEVGDLVIEKSIHDGLPPESVAQVVRITPNSERNGNFSCNYGSDIMKSEVIAICKKQSNGDYIRYNIKNNN